MIWWGLFEMCCGVKMAFLVGHLRFRFRRLMLKGWFWCGCRCSLLYCSFMVLLRDEFSMCSFFSVVPLQGTNE